MNKAILLSISAVFVAMTLSIAVLGYRELERQRRDEIALQKKLAYDREQLKIKTAIENHPRHGEPEVSIWHGHPNER